MEPSPSTWNPPPSTLEEKIDSAVDGIIGSLLTGPFVNRKLLTIDLIHKWRPIYYSFIFMLISLLSLVSMCKIQKNVCSKTRLGRLISMNIKE